MVMRVGDLKLMVDGIQRKLAAVSTMMHVHSSREVEALLATLNSKFCQSVELQGQNSRSVISLHLLQVGRSLRRNIGACCMPYAAVVLQAVPRGASLLRVACGTLLQVLMAAQLAFTLIDRVSGTSWSMTTPKWMVPLVNVLIENPMLWYRPTTQRRRSFAVGVC